MTLFDDALLFAVEKHSGAVRKKSTLPYIVHPIEVATIAATLTEDPEVLAAAVRHDTVEDTGATAEEIEAGGLDLGGCGCDCESCGHDCH